MEFVDRVSAYPNRYIMTAEDGSVSYVVLERADDPITPGTPLNAETFNQMLDHDHDASDLARMLADGNTVLSSYQYGDTLPAAGTPGRLFFRKVSG